jgi:hypothetical protein
MVFDSPDIAPSRIEPTLFDLPKRTPVSHLIHGITDCDGAKFDWRLDP